jgi:hypothetical protein
MHCQRDLVYLLYISPQRCIEILCLLIERPSNQARVWNLKRTPIQLVKGRQKVALVLVTTFWSLQVNNHVHPSSYPLVHHVQ